MPSQLGTPGKARSDDDGFTLIEIILAMFIVVALMTTVLGLTVSALGTLAQARQRQSGSALATESLESMRALPYATVVAGAPGGCNAALGLANTNTYVTTAGLGLAFTPPAELLSIPAEQLVVNTQSPCVRTVIQGATTYTIRQYVTKSSTSDGFNLTSIASWTKHGGAAATSVERSVTFSPAGCLLDTLHPFSGPCQAAFSGRAGSDAINVTVTQVDPVDPSIVGPLIGSLNLPAASASIEVEQTVAITSTGIGAGAQDAVNSGVVTARVLEANSDPTSGSSRFFSQGYTVPGGTLSPSPAAFAASSSSIQLKGDTAASTTVCTLPTASGTLGVATGPTGELRPCGVATVDVPGNATAHLFGDGLLDASGITIKTGSANIAGGSTAGVCGALAPGCVRSSVSRTVGQLTFAAAAGPSGMWQVINLDEYAMSEKGSTAGTPVGSRSGTLLLWDGAAYTTVNLSATTSGTWSWGAAPSTYPAIVSGGLTITGSLTVTSAGATTTGPADCAASACVTTSRTGSIAGSFLVTSPGGSYRVDVALGGVGAISAYQAAPVG